MKIEHIDSLDAGVQENVPESIKKDYELILLANEQIGAMDLKAKLDHIHHSLYNPFMKPFNWVWTAGFAASITLGVMWWFNMESNNPPVLKSHEAPIYADSATYKSINKIDSSVDNSQNAELKNDTFPETEKP